MECFCGCGTRVSRGLVDVNLQATSVALELLAWDKARTEGKISREECEDVESLIHRGALQYRRLLDTIHGERETAPFAEGEAWLEESEALRHDRQHMSEKTFLRKGTRLKVIDEDVAKLDRQHPEHSFGGAAERTPEAGASEDVVAQLERLGALHAEGVLSDEEFAAAKRRVIGADPLG